MIFQYSYKKVLDRSKTQTRRIVNPGDSPIYDRILVRVMDAGNRIKWKVGQTYAVQPGRAKKAVGRIRITAIRQEQLLNVSEQDAQAEGFKRCEAFRETWNIVHTRRGRRWEDNPFIWVLEFELVE